MNPHIYPGSTSATSSRPDKVNFLKRLQLIQNTAVRLLTRTNAFPPFLHPSIGFQYDYEETTRSCGLLIRHNKPCPSFWVPRSSYHYTISPIQKLDLLHPLHPPKHSPPHTRRSACTLAYTNIKINKVTLYLHFYPQIYETIFPNLLDLLNPRTVLNNA